MPNFADINHAKPFDLSVYSQYRRTIALKVSQGNWFTDAEIKRRWPMCKGLRRIGYHYLENGSPGGEQFRFCWSILKPLGFDPRNDILAIDIEDPQGNGSAATPARDFANAAVGEGLSIGLIYSYFNYAEHNGIKPAIFPPGWRRLWFANYESISDTSLILPSGWSKPLLYARQYTDLANVPGIGSNTDDSRILQDYLSPIINPIPQEDTSMAGWTDADSQNLAAVVQRLGDLYRVGFASRDTAGHDDPTHHFASIAGVVDVLQASVNALDDANTRLDQTNGHLEAIHMLLNDLAVKLSLPTVGDPGDPVPPPPPMPPMPPTVPEAPPVVATPPVPDVPPTAQ